MAGTDKRYEITGYYGPVRSKRKEEGLIKEEDAIINWTKNMVFSGIIKTESFHLCDVEYPGFKRGGKQ